MYLARIIAIVAIGASLAACAGGNIGGPKEDTGTLVGAGAGALIGSQIGGTPGTRVAAAVGGALLGGLIGNRIGAALDDEDKKRAYAAQVQALESGPSGAPVAWRNPDSGRYGNIVPGPAYQQAGNTCRPFTHTIYINGQPQVARGTACRNPDGTWTPLA
jgi:surface antigen